MTKNFLRESIILFLLSSFQTTWMVPLWRQSGRASGSQAAPNQYKISGRQTAAAAVPTAQGTPTYFHDAASRDRPRPPASLCHLANEVVTAAETHESQNNRIISYLRRPENPWSFLLLTVFWLTQLHHQLDGYNTTSLWGEGHSGIHQYPREDAIAKSASYEW